MVLHERRSFFQYIVGSINSQSSIKLDVSPHLEESGQFQCQV